MKKNHVRAKLKRGEASIGTWLVLPDPTAAQLMAGTGFDWLTVEMEHTPTTVDIAARSFAIVAAHGCCPLARVPINSVENIKRVLDTGAWGIIVPLVNSREEAQAVVDAARYRPIGKRTIGGQLNASNYGTDTGTYFEKANDEILVVVMAEHVKAIEAIDDIVRVPGIDVVFIGPNDLHNSMGKKPVFDSDDKEFNDAVASVLKAAKAAGIAAGIHVVNVEQAKRRIAEGFQFIAIGSEAGLMLAKASEIVKGLGLSSAGAAVKY
ncbi:MAG: aldolase/citrate lyase family protein [Verrucomicrobiota bacterium]